MCAGGSGGDGVGGKRESFPESHGRAIVVRVAGVRSGEGNGSDSASDSSQSPASSPANRPLSKPFELNAPSRLTSVVGSAASSVGPPSAGVRRSRLLTLDGGPSPSPSPSPTERPSHLPPPPAVSALQQSSPLPQKLQRGSPPSTSAVASPSPPGVEDAGSLGSQSQELYGHSTLGARLANNPHVRGILTKSLTPPGLGDSSASSGVSRAQQLPRQDNTMLSALKHTGRRSSDPGLQSCLAKSRLTASNNNSSASASGSSVSSSSGGGGYRDWGSGLEPPLSGSTQSSRRVSFSESVNVFTFHPSELAAEVPSFTVEQHSTQQQPLSDSQHSHHSHRLFDVGRLSHSQPNLDSSSFTPKWVIRGQRTHQRANRPEQKSSNTPSPQPSK